MNRVRVRVCVCVRVTGDGCARRTSTPSAGVRAGATHVCIQW